MKQIGNKWLLVGLLLLLGCWGVVAEASEFGDGLSDGEVVSSVVVVGDGGVGMMAEGNVDMGDAEAEAGDRGLFSVANIFGAVGLLALVSLVVITLMSGDGEEAAG
ncbi:MAG TPA: hypothetical protein VLL52_19735 [Anaerolineae bacterium]|nr:hypothetical protein [Anaerolineae bacterium]